MAKSWKNHRYVAIVDGKYIYPEDLEKKKRSGKTIFTASSQKRSKASSGERKISEEYGRFQNRSYRTVIDKVTIGEKANKNSDSKKEPTKIRISKKGLSKSSKTKVSKNAQKAVSDAAKKVSNVKISASDSGKKKTKPAKKQSTGKKGINLDRVYSVYRKR